jgi:hypothetical protein
MWGETWGELIWGNGAVNQVQSIGPFGFAALALALMALGHFLIKSHAAVRKICMLAAVFAALTALVAVAVRNVFQNGTVADANEVNGNFSTLEAENVALRARIEALEAKTASMHVEDETELVFEGINIHIQSGDGKTDAPPNGLGNLIIGYNSNFKDYDRSGSHNLVVGDDHGYSGFGSVVFGYGNRVEGPFSSVSGGVANTASGSYSSVSGGADNTASHSFSSVSGGRFNTASSSWSSVSGGRSNTASGDHASVSGGYTNTASGDNSSVTGGRYNVASSDSGFISAGSFNTATGFSSSVNGGYSNNADGGHSVVCGGDFNIAEGTSSSIIGGSHNTTSDGALYHTVSGGCGNIVSENCSSVSGGVGNVASGNSSSVSGGCDQTVATECGTLP